MKVDGSDFDETLNRKMASVTNIEDARPGPLEIIFTAPDDSVEMSITVDAVADWIDNKGPAPDQFILKSIVLEWMAAMDLVDIIDED